MPISLQKLSRKVQILMLVQLAIHIQNGQNMLFVIVHAFEIDKILKEKIKGTHCLYF